MLLLSQSCLVLSTLNVAAWNGRSSWVTGNGNRLVYRPNIKGDVLDQGLPNTDIEAFRLKNLETGSRDFD